MKEGQDVRGRDKVGRTPLSWAAANGCEAVVRLLLGSGTVEVESRNDIGRTPLSGHETVVKLLLETGEADDNFANEDGWTMLSWAAKEGHEDS